MEEAKGIKEIMGILFLHSDQESSGNLWKVPEIFIHFKKKDCCSSFCTCETEF